MSFISNWLLSVIGVIIIGMLINIIIPESTTSKYINAVYSFIIVYVIISPIINLISDTKSLSLNYDSLIDSSYIEKINQNKIDTLINAIKNKSSMLGIKNIDVEIASHFNENNLILDKVYVNLQNSIIDENFEHIDKYQVLDEVIISMTKIKRENIVYYE